MNTHRTLSKDDMLAMIEERAKTGITRGELCKRYFVGVDLFHDSLDHYGLRKKWHEAKRRYEKRIVNEAIRLRKFEGIAMRLIEERVGVNENLIYRYAARNGLSKKLKEAKKSENYEAMQIFKGPDKRKIPFSWLYNQRVIFGRTYEEIAKDFNCTPGRVMLACKRHGFVKPPPEVAKMNRKHALKALETDWDKQA